MFFKKKQTETQSCKCDYGNNECDAVAQIRLAQSKIESLQKDIAELKNTDLDLPIIQSIVCSNSFNDLLYVMSQETSRKYLSREFRYWGSEYFRYILRSFVSSIEETGISKDKLISEIGEICNYTKAITNKEKQISQLEAKIRELKQYLEIE